MNVFAFRGGHSLKDIDPQTVGSELERIRKERGTLTPQTVLEEAKSEASPLHSAFLWDDTEAAERYRLTQAREIIVSVRIINSPVTSKVPAFVSVRTPEHGRNYIPTAEAMDDEQLRARVMTEISQFLESMQRRYANFREVADLIDSLKQKVG